MDAITYKKRSGTGGAQGQLFETKLLSLLLFRLQRNPNVAQFYLASNYDDMGAFDDICLRLEIVGRERPVLILVQAKHKEKDDTVLDYELIKNFYHSYIKVKEKFSLKKYDTHGDKIMFEGSFSDTECYFILYTNAKYFKESIQPAVYEHDMLNALLRTADQEAQLSADCNDKDLEILNEDILNEEIDMLATQFTKFLNKKSMNIMQASCILRYHVILAQHVVHVSEVQTEPNQKHAENNAFRIMSFRPDFFHTDDNILNKLKIKICEEFYKTYKAERKVGIKGDRSKRVPSSDTLVSCISTGNSVESIAEDQISLFLSEPSSITLSPLIGTHIVHENEQLKFLVERSQSDLFKLKQLKFSTSLVEEAKVIAAGNILLSLRLKVPVAFGNVDLIIKGNDRKVEKRLNHLMTAIDSLCGQAKLIGSLKVVTLDETDESSSVNQYISDAVGNLLIHDDVTKYFMFTTKYDLLQQNAKDLFDKLRNKINDLHLYRFDVGTVNNIPKVVFDNTHEVKEILNKLLVFEKQANHERVGQILTDEIDNYQRSSQNYLFKPDKNKIFLYYHSIVLEWWLEKEEPPFITKTNNFYDKTLNNMIEDPQLNAMRHVYYTNNMKYFKYDFNHKALATLQYLTNNSTTTIVTDNTTLTTVKVIRWLKNKYDDTHSVIDLELMVNMPQDDFKALVDELTETTKMIVIVCNDTERNRSLHERLDTLTTTTNNKNKIVITDYKFKKTVREYFNNTDNINEEHSITDLTPTSQEELMASAKVLFQGQEVPLCTLVRNSSDIKGAVLNKILRGDIVTIGKPINDPKYEEIKHLYINRRISLRKDFNVIESAFNIYPDEYKTLSTFKDIDDDVVLITATAGMGKSTLLSHMSHKTNEDNVQFWIVRINLLEHTKEFRDNKIMDHVKMLNLTCRVTLATEVENPVQEYDGAVKIKQDVNNADVLLELNLFLNFYNEGKVIFLFDGFDEICPDYKDQVINIFKLVKNDVRRPKMWVTSRPYSDIIVELENVLGKSYVLECINGAEQATYLNKFWQVKIPLPQLSDEQRFEAKICIEVTQTLHESIVDLHNIYNSLLRHLKGKNISNTDNFGHKSRIINKFSGTPLLLYLLANHFGDLIVNFDVKKFQLKSNLNQIYKIFIENKLKIFFESKYNVDLSKPNAIKHYKKELRDCYMACKNMGAYSILRNSLFHDDSQIQEFKDTPFNYENKIKIKTLIENLKGDEDASGLISYVTPANVPVFIHRTFAEFFASEFICDVLKSKIDNDIKRLLFGAICYYESDIYDTWVKWKCEVDKKLRRVLTEDLFSASDPFFGEIIHESPHFCVPRWVWTRKQYIRIYSSTKNDYQHDIMHVLRICKICEVVSALTDRKLCCLSDEIVGRMRPQLKKYFLDTPSRCTVLDEIKERLILQLEASMVDDSNQFDVDLLRYINETITTLRRLNFDDHDHTRGSR